ncbi:hypothetical protein JKP88DRAFT_348584 [Tribonema minus]|uniref:Uncharacterized protein n=1 Tax=Tribonema minus TaxID=303371 RepID=A0A836CHB6_9STRA|nr:hypothetical protein JKP88DRAFT_348584 [Tribonema minus]
MDLADIPAAIRIDLASGMGSGLDVIRLVNPEIPSNQASSAFKRLATELPDVASIAFGDLVRRVVQPPAHDDGALIVARPMSEDDPSVATPLAQIFAENTYWKRDQDLMEEAIRTADLYCGTAKEHRWNCLCFNTTFTFGVLSLTLKLQLQSAHCASRRCRGRRKVQWRAARAGRWSRGACKRAVSACASVARQLTAVAAAAFGSAGRGAVAFF